MLIHHSYSCSDYNIIDKMKDKREGLAMKQVIFADNSAHHVICIHSDLFTCIAIQYSLNCTNKFLCNICFLGCDTTYDAYIE